MRFPVSSKSTLGVVFTMFVCSQATGAAPRVARDAGIADAGRTVVIAAAGDISMPTLGAQQRTSDLIVDGGYDAVLVLGDTQYFKGELENFNGYYDPTWGRFKAITHPVPGNHEYETRGAQGYYAYFGERAGAPAKGYYSFDLGEWHLIALNSNSSCTQVGCSATSAQVTWLKADLRANTKKCVLAYWHHPRFNSGAVHGDNPDMAPFWDVLYAAEVDVVLNGHEHIYERFDPQTPDGSSDSAKGIRQFTVGTGGAGHYTIGKLRTNSAVTSTGAYGVLKLTLKPGSYDWKFIPVAPATFTDTGSAVCH